MYDKYKDKIKRRKYLKNWRRDNKKKIRIYYKEWENKNKKHLRELQRIWHKRKSDTSIKFRIDHIMRVNINDFLKGEKNRRSWEKLVGYTAEDLIKHFEG